jgi:leucyl aminopeptidase
MDINFSTSLPDSGAIVIPVLKGADEPAAIADYDKKLGGALRRAMKAVDFNGAGGQEAVLAGAEAMPDAVIFVIGMGDGKKLVSSDATMVGGKAVARILGKFETLAIVTDGLEVGGVKGAELAKRTALGARLRAYDFDRYRVKSKSEDRKALKTVVIVSDAADEADAQSLSRGIAFARDLVSEPPNILYPESFADRCRQLSELGVKVNVLDVEAMTELGMGSLLGVGQGSARPSRLVTMEWNGGADGQKPAAFVGKGVTFDTGGISLKPGPGMEDMKFDMGGAAAVTGALHAIAGRKAKANVVGLIGLVENMPDGNAQRPSDIVTSMSGQTIEILNTDAEGRLVLADVLTYAQKTFSPDVIVDLATLTGAILISLADEFGGLFTRDDALAEELLKAGRESGESLWRMPLTDAHDEMIKSDIADMKNIGGRDGGSSSAAAFLGKFIEDGMSWAHLDIAGMAWTKKDRDICPKGATGYGVRLLDQFVRARYEQ